MAERLTTHATFAGLTNLPSDRLKGLATIVVGYLRNGRAAAGEPFPYAKLITGSLMMRTDLGSMVGRLAAGERGEVAANADAFAGWVLALANLAGTGGTAVFERRILADFTRGTAGGYDDSATARLTRMAWLRGLAGGVDALSAATTPTQRSTLESMGALGNRFERVGGDAPHATDDGAIMEFRGMDNNLPIGEWSETALRIFDYIVATNRR